LALSVPSGKASGADGDSDYRGAPLLARGTDRGQRTSAPRCLAVLGGTRPKREVWHLTGSSAATDATPAARGGLPRASSGRSPSSVATIPEEVTLTTTGS
jgi:hypothetical protein